MRTGFPKPIVSTRGREAGWFGTRLPHSDEAPAIRSGSRFRRWDFSPKGRGTNLTERLVRIRPFWRIAAQTDVVAS